MKRANVEGWTALRKQADSKSIEIAQQKTASAVSDNAAIAQRIKEKLLRKLEKEIDELPDKIGSEKVNTGVEYGKSEKGNKIRKETTTAYKLRDLTAAYKDLTSDMNLNTNSEQVRIIIDV